MHMDGCTDDAQARADLYIGAASTLERYRAYLRKEIGLTGEVACALTPDYFKRHQAYFLVLMSSLVACTGAEVPVDARKLLDISSYARFRSVVSMDVILDDNNSAQRSFGAYETLIHAEAAVRAAAAAGVSSGKPQRALHRLALSYLKTLQTEKRSDASETALARLLFRKSSMVLLPIEWVAHYGAGWKSVICARAAAIKMFIALQLFDDVLDLERDIARGQNSLLCAHIRSRHPVADAAKWGISDKVVREVMIGHLKVAHNRAAAATLLYEHMQSPSLAMCSRNAVETISTLTARLETYGM